MLFAEVKLQRGDDPHRLLAHGLKLAGQGPRQTFSQPCSCFEGKYCRIYPDRPVRCRTFECGLLKRVAADEMKVNAALAIIRKARARVRTIHELLRQLGETDDTLSLTQRYAKVVARPIDLARRGETVRARSKLVRAMHDLMEMLHRDFRS